MTNNWQNLNLYLENLPESSNAAGFGQDVGIEAAKNKTPIVVGVKKDQNFLKNQQPE
ncbi:hypothetical protein HYT45_02915 [Candidatus Uhrbacteria bacterium]|nr:hypothetical protein [Candidatus Uhrbacteria bacterium]